MKAKLGKNLELDFFGGTHDPEIGIVIAGLPVGMKIDLEALQKFVDRRAPGGTLVSRRQEPDKIIVEQGFAMGETTGEALKFVVKNVDYIDNDYDEFKDIPRPGHADYTAALKYGKSVSMIGGGPFSGRMTLPLCIAGGVAIQALNKEGVSIKTEAVPGGSVEEAILEGDSIGGTVFCKVEHVPAGLGGPLFEGVESRLAYAIFGIPGVKGLDFGKGFESVSMKGSQHNDAYIILDDKITTRTNNAGGILGGITNGMPLELRVAFKPTPSIAKEQDSVNMSTMKPAVISVKGRHDPCIAIRGAVAVEAAVALVLYDLILESR